MQQSCFDDIYNLLTQRDRTTIAADNLPLLDTFLENQIKLQKELYQSILSDRTLTADEVRGTRIEEHFKLLQATDNLSLLSCVGYRAPATLLHALPLKDGHAQEVKVTSSDLRKFRLTPYPLRSSPLTFKLPARHVEGKSFVSALDLQARYSRATQVELDVTIFRLKSNIRPKSQKSRRHAECCPFPCGRVTRMWHGETSGFVVGCQWSGLPCPELKGTVEEASIAGSQDVGLAD